MWVGGGLFKDTHETLVTVSCWMLTLLFIFTIFWFQFILEIRGEIVSSRDQLIPLKLVGMVTKKLIF